jgi:DNA-binding beta-propeller fold protein YncE
MKKIVFIVVACFLLPFMTFAQKANYGLTKKTVIGGEGGWDYLTVDSENRRIYVSHSTQVEVLNADTHEKVGTIPNLQGVHGIIAVPKHGRGITTNGRSNTATVFDLKTLAVIKELPTGKNPDALLYDNFSDRVFIFNHSGGDATVVDIKNAEVKGTIALGGEAVEAGVSDEAGTIFVNLEDVNEVVAFDAKSFAIKNRWKIPGDEPTGIAMDRSTNRLFTVCHSEVMIILDSKNGSVIAQVPIGKRVDGVVFDASSKRAFCSNGEGTITVVQENSSSAFEVVATIPTQPGARTITMDAKTHHIFVSTAQYGAAPAATTENPNPRPPVVPGTFMILEFGEK